MAKAAGPPIVGPPTSDELKEEFEAYAVAVGKVAYAWNNFQEKLAALFCAILGLHEYVGFAIWYFSDNDRAQRNMLKALVPVSERTTFKGRLPPTAIDDVLWLTDRANELAELRNDAVHAPCSFYTDAEGTELKASIISGYSGHKRAKRLIGKQLLVEFDWLERYAESFSRYVTEMTAALSVFERKPWPDRPVAPDRRAKKALLSQRPRPRTK